MEIIFLIIKVVIAFLTLMMGAFVLLRPTAIYNFIGLNPEGNRGKTEIRAIFGGLFVALGAAPLILNSPGAFKMLGYAYIGIAATRIGNFFTEPCLERSNIISLASEIVLGAVLLLLPE
jgi:hypothetical protein